MSPMRRHSLRSFLRDERGATAFVECVILIAVVAIAGIAGFRALGSSVATKAEDQAATIRDLGEVRSGPVAAAGEQSRATSMRGDRASAERTAVDRSETDNTRADRGSTDHAGVDRNGIDRTATDRAATDRSARARTANVDSADASTATDDLSIGTTALAIGAVLLVAAFVFVQWMRGKQAQAELVTSTAPGPR
jgi:Flp pilus assembly pilin Flp